MKSLLLLLFMMLTLMAVPALPQSTLTFQEKCSNAAEELLIASGYKPVENTEHLGQCSWSHQSHYNRKLDHCFMLISGSCAGKKDERYTIANLTDVFEKKERGSYMSRHNEEGVLLWRTCVMGDTQINTLNGHEFNKQTRKWDIVSEGYLNSLKEPFSDTIRKKFDDWVKPFMEE